MPRTVENSVPSAAHLNLWQRKNGSVLAVPKTAESSVLSAVRQDLVTTLGSVPSVERRIRDVSVRIAETKNKIRLIGGL